MRFFVFSLFSLLFLLRIAFAVDPYQFKTQEVEEIKEVSEEIIKRYPPNEYIYVGVGRSPTPVVAFLQATGRDAINFPITSARKYPGSAWSLWMIAKQSDKEKLDEHFKRFIFDRVNLKGRKILLIDYSETGKSLKFVTKALKKFVKQNLLLTEVKALAMVGDGKILAGYDYKDGARNPNLTGIDDSIKIKPNLQHKMHYETYDNYAEYHEFNVWKDFEKNDGHLKYKQDLKNVDGYLMFKQDLQKQMKSLPLQNPCAEIF